MTLSLRAILSSAVWLLGIVLLFAGREYDLAAPFAAGACFVLSLSLRPRDQRALAERGPPIPWDQRDAGEKFSIIMFHLVASLFVLFTAALLAGVGEDAPAPLWRIALGAALLTGVAWQFWRNWTKRNVG